MVQFRRSLHRVGSKQAVIDFYTQSCGNSEEHEKNKWGSPESMLNRFQLALDVVDWTKVRRWLDVGCGTGVLFTCAAKAGLRSTEMVGADITPAMIEEAARRPDRAPATFIMADLESLPTNLGVFDAVSAIGVLQQCGIPIDRALSALASVTAPGGQLYLDTKNIGWRSFREDGLIPETAHSWFDWDELQVAVTTAGFNIVRFGGFLPSNGHLVPMDDSHTLFLLAKRTA